MLEIRFDHSDKLREMISEEFSDWGAEILVTQAMIQEFADITGDQQWIHVDPEKAARGPFGGPIAHGLLTIALLPRVKPSPPFQVIGKYSRANCGAENFRFLATVPSEAKIHARSRVTAVQNVEGGTLISEEIHIHVVGNTRPSLIYTELILYKSSA